MYLLERGADPNRMVRWHHTALHHAVQRDNALENIELMLEYGGDPTLRDRRDDTSAIAIAVRRGRRDVLELCEKRGVPIELHGVERLIAACSKDDGPTVHSIAESAPLLVRDVLALGGTLLAEFAGTGNTDGARQLLDLGVNVAALYEEGDGYFDIAPNSTALHVAAWRARHATVQFLVERGAPIEMRDGKGRTPLALAVRACVDSYWADRRSPESVEALLRAGASVRDVQFPSGYGEVDELLKSHGAHS
jgi:ankyrin repeat protein